MTDCSPSATTGGLASPRRAINSIDITGVETFARLERMVAKRGGTLHVVGLKLPAQKRLERAGLLQRQGSIIALYRTSSEFLARLSSTAQSASLP